MNYEIIQLSNENKKPLDEEKVIKFLKNKIQYYYNKILLPITGVIGVIFGSYLTYAEAFIIHEWCPFCVVAFVLTIAATFFCITEYGSEIKELINKNGIEEEA